MLSLAPVQFSAAGAQSQTLWGEEHLPGHPLHLGLFILPTCQGQGKARVSHSVLQ